MDTQPIIRHIWERQEQESAAAYALAKTYFELGETRSLAETARIVGKSSSHLARLAKQHAWKERAKGYDYYCDQIYAHQREKVLQTNAEQESQQWVQRRYEQQERMWHVSEKLLARAQEMLTTPLDDVRWSLRDAATMTNMAIRLSKHLADDTQAVANGSNGGNVGNTGDVQITVKYVD
jgi:hypothetical protein